jgi:hypothetical protein
MKTDDLLMKVSQAIYEAEHLDRRSSEYKPAWLRVSEAEDIIAMHQELDVRDRNIARRGAVHAALKAGELERAERLVQKYSPKISKEHYRELRSILETVV